MGSEMCIRDRYRIGSLTFLSRMKQLSKSPNIYRELAEWLIPQTDEGKQARSKIMETASKLSSEMDFTACYALITEEMKKERIEQDTNGIYVGRGEEISFLDLDALFVVGMVAGEFPSLRKSNPIIQEKEIANRKGFIPNDQQRALNSFIRLSIRKTPHIHFYFPQNSGSSYQLNPSILIYPFIKNTGRKTSRHIYSSRDRMLYTGKECMEIITGEPQKKKTIPINEEEYKLISWMYERRFNPKPGKFSGIIEDPKSISILRENLGKPITISPTRVDSYLNCPFQYFARYILNLEEKRVGLEPDPLSLGSLIHDVIYEFYSNRRKKALNNELKIGGANIFDYNKLSFIKVKSDEIEEAMEKVRCILRTKFKERLADKFSEYMEPVVDKLSVVIRKVLETDTEKGKVPLSVEFKIDKGIDIEVPIDQDKSVMARLVGKIDRIDYSLDRTFAVGDYKVGRYSLFKTNIERLEKLQLVIYALMLSKLGYKISDIYYYGLDYEKGEIKTGPPRLDNPQETLTEVERGIKEVVANIYNGKFFVSLNSTSRCNRCEFRDLCRRAYSSIPFFKATELGINPNLKGEAG